MKYTFSLLLLIFFHVGYSQQYFGFMDGTIITKKGDSIICQVKREISYGDTVIYKLTTNANEKEITSNNIKGIRFPFKYLENIKIGNLEKLATLIVEGKINLYNYIEMQKGETVTVPDSNGGMFTPSKIIVHYIVKSVDTFHEITNLTFTEKLKQLLNDCPEIITKIENQEYNYENLTEVIKKYNSCKN